MSPARWWSCRKKIRITIPRCALAVNLPDAKVLLAGYLNIRDLLGYDKLVLPLKALDALTAQLG